MATLLLLEKRNVEIFKVSESYVQNCLVRGREVNQLTHAVEAMGIPILLTVQQLGKTFPEVDDLLARRSEGLIPGWEKYLNSQRGEIGAVATIAILLFPPRKPPL